MISRACRCGGIIKDGKCNRCQRCQNQEDPELHLGNDWTWRKISEAFRRDHPYCEDCDAEGRVTMATQVHHRKNRREHPELKYDWDNLMSLCDSCHSKRTNRGE